MIQFSDLVSADGTVMTIAAKATEEICQLMKSINNTESGDRNTEADEVPPVSSIGQAVSSF